MPIDVVTPAALVEVCMLLRRSRISFFFACKIHFNCHIGVILVSDDSGMVLTGVQQRSSLFFSPPVICSLFTYCVS